MTGKRVMVVEDSAVFRKFLSRLIEDEEDLTVCARPGTGELALSLIERMHPDIIILDVSLPGRDGLEILRDIRARWPLPVVMLSVLTERGSRTTLDALFLGADDYVAKPRSESLEATEHYLRRELLPRIRLLTGLTGNQATIPAMKTAARRLTPVPTAPRLIGIGISTGGPAALARILPQLPQDYPIPILVVQHMPAEMTLGLARRLDQLSRITVREAAGGDRPAPGTVLIAPGDRHMQLRGRLDALEVEIVNGPRRNASRPSVDVLFESMALTAGPQAMGIVMTGMGSDGVAGAGAIRKRGGTVVAQDEDSSIVWGMAGGVVAAGHANRVLTLDSLPGALFRLGVRARERDV